MNTRSPTSSKASRPPCRRWSSSAAQNKNLGDLELKVADVVEEIVITSALETVSEGISAETTYSIDEIEDLPVQRNIRSAALLTPGVSASGPKQGTSRNAALVISGAMSFESLYLVNGVVVNENIRGQSLDLFIEDAIQEFTAVASGVSAEYGRFTGGVVNVLTKSGGNELSGSIRRSYTQADWTRKTDTFENDRESCPTSATRPTKSPSAARSGRTTSGSSAPTATSATTWLRPPPPRRWPSPSTASRPRSVSKAS